MSATSMLINDIKNKLLIGVGVTFIVVGTIGNVLNIILFSRRAMWTLSPTIPLLLVASIANLVTIYPYLVLRTFLGFNLTLIYTSSILCKMNIYVYYISICTSTWLMVACCANRFFASSRDVRKRLYGNMKITRRVGIIVITITPCVYVPLLYCYEINQFTKPVPCYQQNSACSAADVANYFVFQSVGPSVCMLLFGIGTLVHIRQGRRLRPEVIVPVVVRNNRTNNRKNNHISMRLLFTQVVVYLLCSMPLLVMKTYTLISLLTVKNNVRISVEALLLNAALLFSLVDKIFSFYIYTLSSKHFRHELIKLFRKNIRQWRTQVQT